MKFKLWREHGALNSPSIFAAVEQGLKKIGMSVVSNDPDIDVIWSVLWYGRMKPNKTIYERAKSQGRQILIIEVGNLFRGHTWRISLDHIQGQGKFGNHQDLDPDRPKKIGIPLKSPKKNRKDSILVACQHEHSLQWQGQPPMAQWASSVVERIRAISSRDIVVRPHPRSPFFLKIPGVEVVQPIKILNSYDDFNIDYGYHCVINHNSGPAVRAIIEGTPVFCHESSLAWPVSEKNWENLENLQLPDREEWFLKLCHTEWTVDEIANGLPFQRLLPYMTKK